MQKEKSEKIARALATSALGFSKIAANTKCMCIFHQPEKPKILSNLSKINHV